MCMVSGIRKKPIQDPGYRGQKDNIQLFESRTCPGLSFVALGEPHWESGINSGTPKTFTNMGSGRKGT